jgi:hypothetical protein
MGYGLVLEWANVRGAVSKKEDTEKQPKKKKNKTKAAVGKQGKRRRHLEEEDEEEEGELQPEDVARQVAEHLKEVADQADTEGRAGIDLVVSAGEGAWPVNSAAIVVAGH